MNQDQKNQDSNKKRALDAIREKLFDIEYKKYLDQISLERKGQVGTMDRSEKIRTYNFPQDRITGKIIKINF